MTSVNIGSYFTSTHLHIFLANVISCKWQIMKDNHIELIRESCAINYLNSPQLPIFFKWFEFKMLFKECFPLTTLRFFSSVSKVAMKNTVVNVVTFSVNMFPYYRTTHSAPRMVHEMQHESSTWTSEFNLVFVAVVSFVHSLNKCMFRMCYRPGALLGTRGLFYLHK